jgi:hypothetical protein
MWWGSTQVGKTYEKSRRKFGEPALRAVLPSMRKTSYPEMHLDKPRSPDTDPVPGWTQSGSGVCADPPGMRLICAEDGPTIGRSAAIGWTQHDIRAMIGLFQLLQAWEEAEAVLSKSSPTQ